jgi:hypothetical protein
MMLIQLLSAQTKVFVIEILENVLALRTMMVLPVREQYAPMHAVKLVFALLKNS